MTAKLCRMGERIAEVPISYAPRTAGEGKKIRHSDGWLAIWTLLRYRFVPRARWVKSGERDARAARRFVKDVSLDICLWISVCKIFSGSGF